MTQLELKFANSNSGSCRTSWAQHSSSFLTAPIVSRRFFLRSVLMMKPHRACMH